MYLVQKQFFSETLKILLIYFIFSSQNLQVVSEAFKNLKLHNIFYLVQIDRIFVHYEHESFTKG